MASRSMTSCIEELESWMTSNRLKLNADKTEFIWTGSRQQAAKINTAVIVLKGHQIVPECSVKCLGVLIDTNLTFAPHIRRVAASCFWQIRQLWKIRRSLSVENAKTLVHALVASRIDFCNSILYRVAAVHLRPLQSVLNAAARLVLKLRKFDRVSISSTIRNGLHWLPVHNRIVYKLCLLVFKCQHKQAPTYLSSLCLPLSAVTTRRQLRAATRGDLDFPRTQTVTYGPRAFAVSGPTCWNSSPSSLKSPSLKPAHFCKQLKTVLMAQPS